RRGSKCPSILISLARTTHRGDTEARRKSVTSVLVHEACSYDGTHPAHHGASLAHFSVHTRFRTEYYTLIRVLSLLRPWLLNDSVKRVAGALKIFRKLSARAACVCYFLLFGQNATFSEGHYIGAKHGAQAHLSYQGGWQAQGTPDII